MQLVSIPFSHYCEKARWGLDHAGLAFEEVGSLPIFHQLIHRQKVPRVRGRRTVPVLVTESGAVTDSTEILRFCDRHAPAGRHLFAGDGDEVAALEDRFDEHLGPHARRVVFFHVLADRDLVMKLARPGVPAWQMKVLELGFPLARGLLRRSMRIDEAGYARSMLKVEGIFAEVDARLGDGRRFLVGRQFSAADLTFAALASVLVYPPEHPRPFPEADAPGPLLQLRDRLRARPSGAFALRMYREWRGTSRS